MKKYPIKREFFPWNLFAPPISEKFLAMSVPHMKPPKSLWRDKELDVTTHAITTYDGEKITCFVMSPKKLPAKAPCLSCLPLPTAAVRMATPSACILTVSFLASIP